MTEQFEEAGMSDMQFKSYLREVVASLERAKAGGEAERELDGLIARLKRALEA